MSPRFSKEDWLKHGLQALAAEGPAALKANILAKSLGVSRGSFYWHFADLEQFHADLLAYWRKTTTEDVIQSLGQQMDSDEQDSGQQLAKLMSIAAEGNDAMERAVRGWAVNSQAVAKTLAEVDQQRINYIASLLHQNGISGEAAMVRGAFVYWANLGRIVTGTVQTEAMTREVEAIARLLASN